MPQLIEYEGKVHEFPDDFSQEDISNALSQVTEPEPLPKTSALGAGLREAAKSILPGVAGAAGWMGAAELAPATGGLSFLIPAGAALASGALAGWGQKKIAKAVIPGYEKTEQADIQQHPIATRVGGIAGALPVFEFAPGQSIRALAQIPKVLGGTATKEATQALQVAGLQAGLGAAGGVVTPLLEGERPTLGGVAEAAATSLLFGKPRWKALLPGSMREAARSISEDTNASRQQEAREVYADVPAQPEQGEGQVPVEKGGERIQPSPGEEGQPGILLRPLTQKGPDLKVVRNPSGEGFLVTGTLAGGSRVDFTFKTLDEAKVALQGITRGSATQKPTIDIEAKPAEKTAEDLAYEEHERQALQHAEEIGGHAEIVDKIAPEDPNQPFAGLIATISPKGRIQIDRGEFRDWLRQVPVDKRDMAVRSLVAEEQNHVLTFKTVGEDGAAKFWRNLTAFEKYAHSRRYAGEGYKERLAGMSDAKLGYEAINSFMQRAARMPMREFIESTGRERWTIKTLDEMANIVFRVREALHTNASKEQVAILDTIQANISAAVAAQRDQQEQPGAIRRSPKEPEELRTSPMETEGFAGETERKALQEQVDKRGIYVNGKPVSWETIEGKIAEYVFFDGYEHYRRNLVRALARAQKALLDPGTSPNSRRFHEENQRELVKEARILDNLRNADIRLGPEFPFPGWKSEYQMRLDLPGAIRRVKKDTSTPEMFTALQGISGEKGKEAEQAAAARDIPRPPLTGVALTGDLDKGGKEPGEIMSYLGSKILEKPSFDEFHEMMRGKYGPEVTTGRLLDAWQKGVWDFLVNAPGKALESLRQKFKVGREVGQTKQITEAKMQEMYKKYGVKAPEKMTAEERKSLEQAPTPAAALEARPVPDATPENPTWHLPPQFELMSAAEQQQQLVLAKAKMRQDIGRQRYRNLVISEIGRKLIGEATETKFAKPLFRKDVTPDDLGWWRSQPFDVFYDIGTLEQGDPEALKRILTKLARPGEKQKVSETLRLVTLIDKETGQVHNVSVYLDPRRGLLVTDPRAPSKMNPQVELESLLDRFQPRYSILLDEPVKDFHQRWKNFDEFNREFRVPAREMAQRESEMQPEWRAKTLGQPTSQEETYLEQDPATGKYVQHYEGVLPSQVQKGAGGTFTGPHAEVVREPTPRARGAVEIEAPEAAALHDLLGEVPGSPRQAVQALHQKRVEGTLTPRDWQAITAMQKAFDSLRKTMRGADDSEVLATLYAKIQISSELQDRRSFIKNYLRTYNPAGTGDVPGVAPAPTRYLASQARAQRRISQAPPVTPRPEQLSPPGTLGPPEVTKPDPKYQPGLPAFPMPSEPTGQLKKFGPTEFKTKSGLLGPRRDMPGAIRKDLKARFEVEKRKVVAMVKGRDISRNVYQRMDGMEANGRQAAFFSGSHIRVQSKNPQVREAAIAMIAVEKVGKDGTRNYQDNFIKELISQTRSGIQQAQEWQTRKNPWYWFWGKRWEQSATRWKKAAEYALEHKDDPELLRVVDAFRDEMKSAIEHENANGLNTVERENYAPGYLEGEFWNAGTLRFGGIRGLGGNFGRPKSFKHYFEAISKGPYIPLSYDAADIAQTRVSRGRYLVNRRIWAEAGKEIRVPGTNYPLVTEPAPIFEPYKDPLTGQQVFDPKTGKPVMVPSGAFKEPVVKQMKSLRGDVKGREPVRGEEVRYKLVNLYENSKPIAVHPEYENVFRNALAQSYLRKMPITRDLLWGIQVAKHGSLLILDTFHLGRLWEYSMASATGKTFRNPFRGGLTALQYRPEDLNAAVRNGFVREADAKWSMEKLEKPIKIRIPYTGKFEMIETNHDLGRYLVKNGLNAVGTADALWKDAIKNVPGIGEMWHKAVSPLNRFLFDKLTPGLMMQTAINNFKKYQASHPNVPPADLAADVIRDTNGMYGNMGRQGIFKNPTWRDFAQLFLLAPVWQEGLLQKEVRFMGRLGALPLRAGAAAGIVPEGMVPRRGLPAMGTIGEAMAKGLLAFAAGTQIINLYTKGHFTWENEEEGHKMDAWIPTGEKGRGLWLSPMSVFAELTHDMIRYGETKPTVWDAALQIGENKLGPMGRLAMVLGGRQTSTGEHITSTAGIMKEAGKQMAPLPISLSVGLQKLGSMVGMAKPPTPEQWIQRSLGAFGFKVQTRERNESFVSRMAKDFMKKEGLHKETGWEEVQTDQPGYTKLRSALRLGDERGAVNMLEAIRKTHSDQDIIKAMMAWEKRPFTSNSKAERLWLSGLNEKELGLYNAALDDRLDVIGKFYELMLAN